MMDEGPFTGKDTVTTRPPEPRDYYQEALDILLHHADRAHLQALWDANKTMTLRMADLHTRAQQAEQERDHWKARVLEAESDLEEVLGEFTVPISDQSRQLQDHGQVDECTAAKADLDARGAR